MFCRNFFRASAVSAFALVPVASGMGGDWTSVPPGTPLFSTKPTLKVVADKPAAPAVVAVAPSAPSITVLGACDPCQLETTGFRKWYHILMHKTKAKDKDHGLKDILHKDKGPKPHCDSKVYPLSEAKYIHSHCGPTICAGSCYGFFPNQWRPWDCSPDGCTNQVNALPVPVPVPAPATKPAPNMAPAPVPVKPMPIPMNPNEGGVKPSKPVPTPAPAPTIEAPKLEPKKDPEPMVIPMVPTIPANPPKIEEPKKEEPKKEEKKKPAGVYDIQIEPPSPLLFPTRLPVLEEGK